MSSASEQLDHPLVAELNMVRSRLGVLKNSIEAAASDQRLITRHLIFTLTPSAFNLRAGHIQNLVSAYANSEFVEVTENGDIHLVGYSHSAIAGRIRVYLATVKLHPLIMDGKHDEYKSYFTNLLLQETLNELEAS